MRIAFISTLDHAVWGGSEVLWSRTVSCLLNNNVSVAVRVRQWPFEIAQIKELEKLGCVVIHQPLINRRERLLRKIDSQRPYHWIDNYRPDLVVITMCNQFTGSEWMQACKRRNIPYAIVIQAAGEVWWPGDKILEPLRIGFENAKKCYFVSAHNLDLVCRQFAIPLHSAKVIRNPFNVSYTATVPWPDSPEVFRLACIGRLEPFAKGQDLLIQVLSSSKWRERPLTVTLYGDGENRETLKSLKDLLAVDNVVFGGVASDIELVWADHHALVLPSRVEGMPLALVEAMLCARPAIVTDVGGNSELVEDGVSGFIAPAATKKLLDNAMEKAWELREKWYEIGQAASVKIRQMIPPDPAQEFANELSGLVASFECSK